MLAWPSVVTMLLQTVNSLMDALFVGHLPHPAESLAATGIGGGIIFLLVSLAMGVSVGTTALVARFVGAKEEKSAVLAVGQSLSLAAALGLCSSSLLTLVGIYSSIFCSTYSKTRLQRAYARNF